MQKLSLTDEEKLSRKEYLKKKKKQTLEIKNLSKRKYVIIFFVFLLMLYVFVQYYIYYKKNNYKLLLDESLEKQKVYDMYYVSIGYTYSPMSSLNKIKSNGFDETLVYKDLCFSNIKPQGEYIYGIKEGSISKLNKTNLEIAAIYENDVKKYTIYNNEIYAIVGDNNKLVYIDTLTNESKSLEIDNVVEILVDDNYLFLCIDELSKKTLVRINKDGSNKKVMTDKENISYIIQNEEKIFFVNKSDGSKVYSVNKDGSKINKVADIKSITDTGIIANIDGSRYLFVEKNYLYYVNTDDQRNLWRINLEDNTNEKVISMPVDILEKVENTVFYKVKDEKGVYLYNLDTKFTARVSSRLITEFVVNK